jgi:hypothetical protein
MKLFIGWSGERSHQMALALRDWLPLVLYHVESWVSETDIAAGERWAQSIGKELEASNFGIMCLTRENVSSQWIVFEAGSLAKSLEDGRVIPLLLDLEFSEITGPLAQFQAKKADRDGLSEVAKATNKAAPEPVEEAKVAQLFDALWPQLEGRLASIPQPTGATKTSRPQHEILEELVGGVRSLDSRLRDLEGMAPEQSVRRGRLSHPIRLDPFMLREMAMMIGDRPGDPLALLMFASMFREDFPWLYEIGTEAYRAARAGAPDAQLCIRRFKRAAELLLRGPFAEELGIHPKELHMLTREMERFLVEMGPIKDEPTSRGRRRKAEEDEGTV